MKEYFIQEKGIYYKANDFKDNRPTILFIHGLSGSSSAWNTYEEKFKEKYNVISYDLRGHGKSKRFNNYNDYVIENFVDDIHHLLSYVHIRKLFVVSHSFGTLFALDFVLQYQDMILGAIFLSPNFNIGQKWLGIVMIPLTAGLHMFWPDNSQKQGRHIDYSKFINTGDWNIPRMIQDVGNTGLKAYLYCTKQVCSFNREELLVNLTIPVLVMHGKKDSIFPARNSMELPKKIKNMELIILEKSDHILVLNNFEEVSTAIEKFVDKVSDN